MSEVMRYDPETCAEMVPADDGQYVESNDFDRVTAERDALQQRLNEADERNDELSGMLQHLVNNPYRFTEAYREQIAVALKREPAAPSPPQPISEQFIEDHLGNPANSRSKP